MNNLELIEKARKMLTAEYNTKHTNEYNSWLAAHKNSWMQPHTIVPFPPFVVSAALAPFKPTVMAPSEEAVVAKALELYNQANPAPAPVVEASGETTAAPLPVVDTVIEEPVVQSVVEEVVESSAEPVVEEPVVLEPTAVSSPLVEEIYKIYQAPIAEADEIKSAEPAFVAIETALAVVPQPAEELAKVSNTGRILPSVLQRLQDMKLKWASKE